MPTIFDRESRTNTPIATTMATANAKLETRISSAALDVLRGYVSEFDEIVLEFAEMFARERLAVRRGIQPGIQQAGQQDQPVLIEVEDVQRAAEMFTDAIRSQFGNDPKRAGVVATVEGMHECLKEQCQATTNQPR